MSYNDYDYGDETFYRPRKRRIPEVVWTTRDGETLSLPEIEDTHLQNIIVYMTKRKREWEDTCLEAEAAGGPELGSMIVNGKAVEDWLALFYAEVKRRQAVAGV